MSYSSGIGIDVRQAANGMETPESCLPSGENCTVAQQHQQQQALKCKLECHKSVDECRTARVTDGELQQHNVKNCEGQYSGVHTDSANNGDLDMPHRSADHTHTNTVALDWPHLDQAMRTAEGEELVLEEEHSVRPPAVETLTCTSPTGPCPPHVMAEVRVRNPPERERIVRGMQDSKSLDEISQACGGAGTRGRLGQPEGRRATISSALELEGTVSHEGDLTHFITRNLEHKIKMSSRPSVDSNYSGRSRGSLRRPADIPPIDPSVLSDLLRHAQDVAHSVELMMRSLNGTIQNMTALSVGYIQTYRDSVDSLGEAVDMSIKGMYTLMARCEELDRSMQPIHSLAKQIRDIKRTLDAMESLCK